MPWLSVKLSRRHARHPPPERPEAQAAKLLLAQHPRHDEHRLAPGLARAESTPPIQPESLTLPKGPGSLKGLGESFAPNLATGTGNYSVPLEVPPSLLAPALALRYSGGTGRTKVGVGFRLPVLHIYRTTDKGLPEFTPSDRFAVSGPELNDELVRVSGDSHTYRVDVELVDDGHEIAVGAPIYAEYSAMAEGEPDAMERMPADRVESMVP